MNLSISAKSLCLGEPEVSRVDCLDRRAASPGLFLGLAALLARRFFLALLSPSEFFLTLLELGVRSTSQREPSFGTRIPDQRDERPPERLRQGPGCCSKLESGGCRIEKGESGGSTGRQSA